MLVKIRKRDFIKVLDFGLVKQLSEGENLTRTGLTVGSPMFMAPEQISDGEMDQRTDIYALGVVCFMLLTGETPFPKGGALEVCMAHLTTPPLRFEEVAPVIEVPLEFQEIVYQALEKQQEDRQESVDELKTVLKDYLGITSDDSASIFRSSILQSTLSNTNLTLPALTIVLDNA